MLTNPYFYVAMVEFMVIITISIHMALEPVFLLRRMEKENTELNKKIEQSFSVPCEKPRPLQYRPSMSNTNVKRPVCVVYGSKVQRRLITNLMLMDAKNRRN